MVGGWATIFEFKDCGWLAIEQGKWVGATHGKKKKEKKSHNLAINRGVLLLIVYIKTPEKQFKFWWEIEKKKIFLSM